MPSGTWTRFLIDQLCILHEVVVRKWLEVKPEHSNFLLETAKQFNFFPWVTCPGRVMNQEEKKSFETQFEPY